VESYVKALSSIFEFEVQSRKISKNASEIAHHQFDSFRQVLEFEGYLMQENNRRLRKKKKIYGSRLDNEIIPNIITIILRKLKSLWDLHCFL
jgi:RNA:NAD 2'-phosphotransferase (TPT1/KptA family)